MANLRRLDDRFIVTPAHPYLEQILMSLPELRVSSTEDAHQVFCELKHFDKVEVQLENVLVLWNAVSPF